MNVSSTRQAAARWATILLLGLAFSSMGSTYCVISSSHHDDDCHYHGSTRHCGHSSSHSHSSGVVVLITDRPSDELRSLFVTIEEVILFGGELGPQVVYSSSEGLRVDLLSLRGSASSRLYELVVGETSVPAGEYHAMSLRFTNPVIVLRSGEVVDAERVELVSGGRVEVELEPVFLSPDHLTYVVVDFDAGRSVSFASERDLWTIRPLLLVELLDDSRQTELGTPLEAAGSISEVTPKRDSFALELTNARGPVDVALGPDVVVLDAQGRVGRDALRAKIPATVRGVWNRAGQLEARTITLGRLDALSGIVKGADPRELVGTLALSVELLPGQALAGDLLVLGDEETLVSVDRRDAARDADLRPGARVVVTGRHDGEVFRARAVDVRSRLRTTAPDKVERIAGVVAAVDSDARTALVETEDGWRRLTIGRHATIIGVTQGPEYLLEEPLRFRDLLEGARIEAEVGSRGDTSSFVVVTEP